MKSIIKIINMDSQEDSRRIQEVIVKNAGVVASQVSLNKKEVTIVYDELSVNIEKVIETLEDLGYMVI